MKKSSIFLLAALALGFTACDDSSDLGKIQSYPQESVFSAEGVTVELGQDIASKKITLADYADQNIELLKIVSVENMPADAVYTVTMQLADNADFNNATSVDVKDVTGTWWDAWFKETIGNTKKTKSNWVRFSISTVVDHTDMHFKSWYAATELEVTPFDLGYDIAEGYTLNFGGNSVNFDHSASDVYDDPTFSVIFTVENNTEWNITADGRTYGVAETGDPAEMAGTIVENGAKGLIKTGGEYKMVVDMLNMTYTIMNTFEYLYTPGGANGWSFTDNMLLSTSDFVKYAGYVVVDTDFKLTAQPSWDGLEWGGADGKLVLKGSNITGSGLNYVEADLTALTYKVTPITTIGIIGDFNEWAGDVAMTASDDLKVWTGEVDLPAGKGWKFRMNGGWDYNLGGSIDDLVQGGDNLTVEEDGTYVITLNLGKLPYSCTVVKK